MALKNHLDDHPLQAAFLANRLDRLAELIVEQGETLLTDVGVEIPPRAVSAILIIGEQGAVSTADIAEMLGQQHQVTTQRIELLIADDIITRTPDPGDRRRKILTLTKKGREQYASLRKRLETAARAFEELSEEIGCNLPPILDLLAGALKSKPLVERVREIEARTPLKSKRKTTS